MLYDIVYSITAQNLGFHSKILSRFLGLASRVVPYTGL